MAERGTPTTDKGWQVYLSNIRPAAERVWVPMGSGLTVCIEPSGNKTFQARLRRQGETNPRRVRIGSFPACSVADARRRMLEMKSVAKEGRDPALEQRRARAGATSPRTLGDLITEYLARREALVAPKTQKIERDLLEEVLRPALGDRLLSDLAPVDFGRVVTGYAARLKREGRSDGTNANKLLAASRRMFKMARGWGVVGAHDPTEGLARPAKEEPRDRVLFDGALLVGPNPEANEIGLLVTALIAEPSPIPVSRPTRVALLLALHLGLRALEVCALEWSAIHLEGASPTLTITRSKTRAGLRTLPLSAPVVELLRELREAKHGVGVAAVFPAEPGATRVRHLHSESLSRAFARGCARLAIEGASTHDLRRTALSGLIELGHESVADRIAGHVPRGVLRRHYDRSSRTEPMRIALEAWSNAVEAARARYAATGKP